MHLSPISLPQKNTKSLVSWDKLGGIGKSIVDGWVCQVIRQVFKRSLSGDDGLDKESKHGEHGKTSILDLLYLELSKSFWVIGQTEWVEWTTWVEFVQSLGPFKVAAAVAVSLDCSHQDDLDDEGGNNAVGVDEPLVSQVLDTLIGKDLGSSLEPRHVSSVGRPFWNEASQSSKHSPASMNELQLTVAGKGLWVGRQSGRVPAIVSWEFTSQIWDIWGEGTQVLWAIWSIPTREKKKICNCHYYVRGGSNGDADTAG